MLSGTGAVPYTAVDAVHQGPGRAPAGLGARRAAARAASGHVTRCSTRPGPLPGSRWPWSSCGSRAVLSAGSPPHPTPSQGGRGAYSLLALGVLAPGLAQVVPAAGEAVLGLGAAVDDGDGAARLARRRDHARAGRTGLDRRGASATAVDRADRRPWRRLPLRARTRRLTVGGVGRRGRRLRSRVCRAGAVRSACRSQGPPPLRQPLVDPQLLDLGIVEVALQRAEAGDGGKPGRRRTRPVPPAAGPAAAAGGTARARRASAPPRRSAGASPARGVSWLRRQLWAQAACTAALA